MSVSRTQVLLSAASAPLVDSGPGALGPGPREAELADLLGDRNGFYAFASALHVFASGAESAAGGSLEAWNDPDGWRSAYGGLVDGYLFFAEDVLGSQFAIRDDRIHTFDPETGQFEVLASSVEDWADQLLTDYDVLTGYPLARDWQQEHGALPPGKRLVPKIPFVLGGDFVTSNVYAADAAEGMRVRGDLALQLRDLPDGAKVRYRVLE